MKRIEYLSLFANLFRFKSIYDKNGNEYIIFDDNSLDSIDDIVDRTAFEAYENHVHLLNYVSAEDYLQCTPIARSIGNALLCSLQASYPGKSFIVYVSIRKRDSMIIRFHQKWENETPYYNPECFISDQEQVIRIES